MDANLNQVSPVNLSHEQTNSASKRKNSLVKIILVTSTIGIFICICIVLITVLVIYGACNNFKKI